MWAKFKKILTRTKGNEDKPVERENKEIVVNSIRRSPLPSDCCRNAFCTRNLRDENSFLAQGSPDDCRCSPLPHLQKHFFPTFRSKKNNEECCDRCSDISRSMESPKSTDDKAFQLPVSQLLPRTNIGDDRCLLDSKNDACLKPDPPHNHPNFSCEEAGTRLCHWQENLPESYPQMVVLESTDISTSPCTETKLSPPKLKRREKFKVQDLLDSERDNLSIVQFETETVLQKEKFTLASEVVTYGADFGLCDADGQVSCVTCSFEGNDTGDCCFKNQVAYANDDKAESTDSGRHPSDADIEKGHSSPDLDMDECDGRESGYTTLDDIQPLEPTRLLSYDTVGDSVRKYEVRNSISSQLQLLEFCHTNQASQQGNVSRLDVAPMAPANGSSWFQAASDSVFSSAVPFSAHLNSNESESFSFVYGDGNDRTMQRWEHVDYVPADVSVSKIYEDASNSGTSDVYASVPRCTTTKVEETWSSVAPFGRGKDIAEACVQTTLPHSSTSDNSLLLDADFKRDSSSHVLSNSAFGVVDDACSATACVALAGSDSDDSEILPPLPSRNYETWIAAFSSSTSKEVDSCELDSSEETGEQIHMTWEELMTEAKCLGIPLNCPQVVKPSPSLMRQSSHGSTYTRESWSRDFCSTDQACNEQAKVSKFKADVKKSSPFKEKFLLPNPFSRRNKLEKNEALIDPEINQRQGFSHGPKTKGKRSIFRHHSSVDVQRRSLPVPPQTISSVRNEQIGSCDGRFPAKSNNQRMAISLHIPLNRAEDSTGTSWGSSNSVLHGLAMSGSSRNGSRRVLSDASVLPFNDFGNGTGHWIDSALNNIENNADFIRSFSKLKDCGWYWGPLSWEDAEAKLEDKPDGSFLVRDSSDDRYILSLSFRSQNATHHTRIEHYKGMFSFYSQPKSHGTSTIVEFIEKAMEHSRNGKFLYFLRARAPGLPPAPVQLLFPISRLRHMHSLQHICRFVILRHVRRDLIDLLPIPLRMKEYLKQTQYYIEYSDCDATGYQYFSQDW